MRLLIEFGQTRAARELLGRLAGKGLLTADRDLLGDVLHVALRFGSREAVGELLRRGADLDLYARRMTAPAGLSGTGVALPGTSLCDLVVAAGRREITSYVRDLMSAALATNSDNEMGLLMQQSGIQLDRYELHLEHLKDDRQTRLVLDRIYGMVMAGIGSGKCPSYRMFIKIVAVTCSVIGDCVV